MSVNKLLEELKERLISGTIGLPAMTPTDADSIIREALSTVVDGLPYKHQAGPGTDRAVIDALAKETRITIIGQLVSDEAKPDKSKAWANDPRPEPMAGPSEVGYLHRKQWRGVRVDPRFQHEKDCEWFQKDQYSPERNCSCGIREAHDRGPCIKRYPWQDSPRVIEAIQAIRQAERDKEHEKENADLTIWRSLSKSQRNRLRKRYRQVRTADQATEWETIKSKILS